MNKPRKESVAATEDYAALTWLQIQVIQSLTFEKSAVLNLSFFESCSKSFQRSVMVPTKAS